MIVGVPQLVGGFDFWETLFLPEIEQLFKIRRYF
jgi:hypothetical protein